MVDMEKYSTRVGSRHVYNYSPCRPENPAYDFSATDPCTAIHYFWLWPNTVVYAGPGQPNMSVLQFIPIAPDRTLRRSLRFFAAPEDGAAVSQSAQRRRDREVNYLNNVLGEEDIALCESIQQGIASRGYQQGRFVLDPDDGWTTERAVAQFHALCHDALSAECAASAGP